MVSTHFLKFSLTELKEFIYLLCLIFLFVATFPTWVALRRATDPQSFSGSRGGAGAYPNIPCAMY